MNGSWDHHANLARGLFPDMDWNTMGPTTPRAQKVPNEQTETQSHHQSVQSQRTQEYTPAAHHQPQQDPQQSQTEQLTSWLSTKGISDNVSAVLIRNGFVDYHSFSHMKKEDIGAMGIHPLAQRRILEGLLDQQAAKESSSTERSNSEQCSTHQKSSTEAGPMEPTITALWNLLKAQAPTQERPSAAAAAPLGESPFPKFTSGKGKHLDIVDFLHNYEYEKERIILGIDGEEQIVLRGANTKPKLEQVTPMQWLGASIRIMRELRNRGDLKVTDLDYYFLYLEKVSELTSRYTWKSMLLYDREYRRWQAQTGHQWATDNIHLVEVHLDVRSKQASTPSSAPRQLMGSKHQQKSSQNKPQTEVCRQFNIGRCPWGDHCKFQHVCLDPQCHGNHALKDHPKSSTAPKNAQKQD